MDLHTGVDTLLILVVFIAIPLVVLAAGLAILWRKWHFLRSAMRVLGTVVDLELSGL